MLVGERGHEVVAVIVIWLHAELDALVVAGLLRCLHKVLREQLLLVVKVVSGTLIRVNYIPSQQSCPWNTHHIDEHLQRALPLLYELRCVVLLPLLLLVLTKVSLEGLLSPRAVDWVGNWCECGD
jgi:hypothetical protein